MSETLDIGNPKEEGEQKLDKEAQKGNTEEVVNWKEQCIQGNIMPAIIMLEQKRINVNDIVNPENGNTILHYATYYSFYNVIRALIEIYGADPNIQNIHGFSPLFYIISNLDINVFNFQYLAKVKNINLEVEDQNGLNLLVHSMITKFHYAFLYFSYIGLVNNHKNDKFKNPLIYFPIVNNNKFALTYLLLNKNHNINDRYYNNSVALSDVLITNKNTSITKFLVKYFNEEINLNTINTCKKNLLNFSFYNIFNYELLNTLYFYKTKNYFKFILGIIKNFSPKYKQISNQVLLEDDKVNEDIGYKYKMINLKYMVYDLILPGLSKCTKNILVLCYILLFYFCTKSNLLKAIFVEEINTSSLIYTISSILLLYLWFIVMSNSSDKILEKNVDIESDIVNTINNGNVVDLPYIDEICPACASRKKLSDTHCFRCKGCFNNKFFHSNLFQICITKNNIARYLFWLILKINFYLLCLFNCLERNETNKSISAFFLMFKYKTSLITALLELFVGFFLFKEIGHFVALLFCLSVKTPYQFIYKYHKKVYPNTLKEKSANNMIVQSPEINDYIKLPTGIKNIIQNIC